MFFARHNSPIFLPTSSAAPCSKVAPLWARACAHEDSALRQQQQLVEKHTSYNPRWIVLAHRISASIAIQLFPDLWRECGSSHERVPRKVIDHLQPVTC